MNLKEFLVIRNHDDNMEVWTKAQYEKYISETLFVGACPAVSIITHFNWEDELLKDNSNEEPKEGGGMRWVKASERLPEESRDKEIHLRWKWGGNTVKGVGRYVGYFVDNSKGTLSVIEDEVEWLDEYAAQFAGTREEWISVEERMPQHNAGVLVFIPAEDNHITSGMWDINNEWVLLDEYRSPQGEVTHWRNLPNPPK